MATKKAKAKSGLPRVTVGSKWTVMQFFDSDDADSPPYLLEVRKDLTFEEADTLQFDIKNMPAMPVLWDILAPFVRDWNLDDADGEPIPAPKEAGGQQFNFLPMGVFWKCWSDLKWRSSGALESKRYSASVSPLETGTDAHTATTE